MLSLLSCRVCLLNSDESQAIRAKVYLGAPVEKHPKGDYSDTNSNYAPQHLLTHLRESKVTEDGAAEHSDEYRY